MQDFVIQPQDGRKGRSFQATSVAMVLAGGLTDLGSGNCLRPVWAMFAGPEAALRPFMMNLRLGRKADPVGRSSYSRQKSDERIEFMKSVGYCISWQREPEGSLATIYHPDLFRLDPGMVDPDGINFVMMVPSDWAAQQAIDPKPAWQHVARLGFPIDKVNAKDLLPAAYWMAAYLDRRTRCPMPADGKFYLQLLIAALDQGLASTPTDNLKYGSSYREWGFNQMHGFRAAGLESIGISQALSFSASHEVFEKFLADQVTLYFS